MFKMYDCGCIGFVTNAMTTEPGAKQVTCFKSCGDGRSDNDVAVFRRDGLQTKTSRKLTDTEILDLFGELADSANDARALRELRCALRNAGIGR